MTRPGGVIAYVTCSPHAAETQNIVAEALESGKVHLLDARTALQAVALQESDRGESGNDGSPRSVLAGEKDPGTQPEVHVKRGAPAVTDAASSTAQLWPHVHGTDAMFLALFRKK